MKTPLQVFCCYARKHRTDRKLLDRLRNDLKGLEREGIIMVRADVDINAGLEWEKEIHHFLNAAHVILLLISPDFMASEYCRSVEMQQAIERHECGKARIIPIILRPTHWCSAPFSKLQVLPSEGKPISDWKSLDSAFLDIVRGIQKVVEELRPRTIPIAGELLAQLNQYKRMCEVEQKTPFLTPHVLLALLDIDDSTTRYYLGYLKPDLAATIRGMLKDYITVDLPKEGGAFSDFEWEERLDVQKAQQLALKEGCATVTEQYLLLGVLSNTESFTIQQLKNMLKDDFDKLLEIAHRKRPEIPKSYNKTPGTVFR